MKDPVRELEWLRRARDLSLRLASEPAVEPLVRLILDAAIELSQAERGYLVRVTPAGPSEPARLKVEAVRGFGGDTVSSPGTIFQINIKIPAPHRKFESFDALSDELACDSPGSGSSTHGNVTASLMVGNAGKDFDVIATYQPNRAEILTGLNLDGLARGARLVFDDIGDAATHCLLNELLEVGGSLTVPGIDLIG